MSGMSEWEKTIVENKPVKCDNCGDKIFYIGSGIYKCKSCNYEMYDYFGKVKKYLNDNGPTPSAIIAQETGVPLNIIGMFLKKGRVEIPDGSNIYIKCEKCGCSIRFGRFCPECALVLANGVKVVLAEDIGSRPKIENCDMTGKVRFLNRKSHE